MRLLKSNTFSPLFSDSLDRLIVAINQKELIKKLTTEGLDPNAAQLKTQEYFQLAKNNGKIVDWIMAREKEGLDFPKISTFMDWFKRNLQNIPFQQRDIFKIDTKYINDTLSKQEKEETQQTQARSAKSIVFAEGPYSVVKADTPEAIVEVANCEGVGANSWCIKGLDYAKRYGPPIFFIKKNGKLYVAVVPHAEIRDLVNSAPSATLAKEVFKPVKFIIDNYSDGIWPSSETFQEFRFINNELLKQSLSPEDQQKYEELSENPRAYPINTLPEVLRLEVLKQVPNDIEHITNPTEKEQIVALRFTDDAESVLRLILDKNIIPTEQVQLEAVRKNGLVIDYIKNPSEQVQLEAVRQNGSAIRYINNPSEQVQLAAVRQFGRAISYINNPSEQLQLEAVKQDGWAIEYIKNPSEQLQLEAVKQTGSAIEYIKNPYPSVVDYVNNAKNKTAIKLTIKE